jgi:cytochrome c oxidase cbb3-type subunit III
MGRAFQLVWTVALMLLIASCTREQRTFRPAPALASPTNDIQVSQLRPGTTAPPTPPVPGEYKETAEAIRAGQQLFDYYNCTGCHAHGGGAIGPPLMDNNWVYGSEPANIYATILDGRPNGMPSWRGRMPDYQVWELVAYVRALSGLVPKELAIHPAPDIIVQRKGAPPGQVTGTTGIPHQRCCETMRAR